MFSVKTARECIGFLAVFFACTWVIWWMIFEVVVLDG